MMKKKEAVTLVHGILEDLAEEGLFPAGKHPQSILVDLPSYAEKLVDDWRASCIDDGTDPFAEGTLVAATRLEEGDEIDTYRGRGTITRVYRDPSYVGVDFDAGGLTGVYATFDPDDKVVVY